MPSDQYQTINGTALGEYKEKGSKFIAYATCINEEKDIKDFLQQVKKEHPKARHHCYAYRIGLDKLKSYRANDDGEPSGSAGRPILGQIDSKKLTNIMVIVVRYFGGTKLGVPGLIRSYKTATKDAFQSAEIVKKRIKNFYKLAFDYVAMNKIMKLVKKAGLEIQKQGFDEKCILEISVNKSDAPQIEALLADIDDLETTLLYTV